MQVAASISELDVCYIALPQLVGGSWFKSLDEILPLVKAVVGVRRGATLARLLHKVVSMQ